MLSGILLLIWCLAMIAVGGKCFHPIVYNMYLEMIRLNKIIKYKSLQSTLVLICIQRDQNPRQWRIRPERTALDHSAMNAYHSSNYINYIYCLNIRQTTTTNTTYYTIPYLTSMYSTYLPKQAAHSAASALISTFTVGPMKLHVGLVQMSSGFIVLLVRPLRYTGCVFA